MMRVIGLISGTSMDAIDAAVVDIDRDAGEQPARLSVTLRAFATVPYPKATRDALDAILHTGARVQQGGFLPALASLDVAIGEAFAAAATIARKEAAGHVDLIGSHGQTVSHAPRPAAGTHLFPATLQIGEAAVIAERTGLTTVADFRVADVAAGGEGAPLVSYVDHLLLGSSTEFRAALNIGGIANVTLLPPGALAAHVRAFDTGPGNMPIDLAVQMVYPDGPGFDRNGQIAAHSALDETLLEWLLKDPYFGLAPPKTAGREQFGPEFVARAQQKAEALSCPSDSLIATLTELTARTIAAALPSDCQRVIASGGGVHNKTLMRALARVLSQAPMRASIDSSENFGMPPDAKEAMAFAVLAFEAVHGRPSNLPHATGAAHPQVLGKIVPGLNFVSLMRSIWR